MSTNTETTDAAPAKPAPKKRKRGQGEGCIVKRADGRWVAILNLGYVDGKRKRKSFYGKTRAEVAALLTAAQHDQKQGITPTDGRLTVRHSSTAGYPTRCNRLCRPEPIAVTRTRPRSTLSRLSGGYASINSPPPMCNA